jgi:heme/copper-type cytochrome/quinol oxidase subunit 2
MKKYIIASAICIFPIILLGIVIPIVTFFDSGEHNYNETVFWIYMSIYTVCLTVISSTIFSIQKYASKINDLDNEEKKLFEKNEKLDALISKYNDLIYNSEK